MSSEPVRPNRPIAIIGGSGPVGMGLALRWARAGERIIIGSRDEQRATRPMSPGWKMAPLRARPTF